MLQYSDGYLQEQVDTYSHVTEWTEALVITKESLLYSKEELRKHYKKKKRKDI
jgi:hypothetical protein